jgi:hypothetical protein
MQTNAEKRRLYRERHLDRVLEAQRKYRKRLRQKRELQRVLPKWLTGMV